MYIPAEYICPSPLPLPSFQCPLDYDSISPEIIDLLRRIGYRDDEELKADFANSSQTMAKVFYFMLSSQISIGELHWEESVGGITEVTEDEAIMMSPIQRSFALSGDDPFHRHQYRESQSVEMSCSAVITADWAIPDPREIVYEQIHAIACPSITLAQTMSTMQALMRHLDMQWFHPDDETIFCRHAAQGVYAVIQGKEDATSDQGTTIQLQLCIGTREAFSVLVVAARDALAQASEPAPSA
jgi:BR serine/threonine kinase